MVKVYSTALSQRIRML
jgi:hypothetical protein